MTWVLVLQILIHLLLKLVFFLIKLLKLVGDDLCNLAYTRYLPRFTLRNKILTSTLKNETTNLIIYNWKYIKTYDFKRKPLIKKIAKFI